MPPAKTKLDIFYVYEHWRPDKDVCFWVGKGHGTRSHDFRRNFHHSNVVRLLARLGMCVEVRLVQSGMSELAALDLEKARIAFWRSSGVDLTNYTDGGEGVSGLRHSEKTRALISEKRKKQSIIHSEETKRKIGDANRIAMTGKKNPEHSARMMGRKLSDDHKAAISRGGKGRVDSEETRKKRANSNMGKKRSPEARANMRAAHLGKPLSEEHKRNMSAAQLARWARQKHKEPT